MLVSQAVDIAGDEHLAHDPIHMGVEMQDSGFSYFSLRDESHNDELYGDTGSEAIIN